MDGERSWARGRKGNCAAIYAIGTCRCLRLASLAIVIVYASHLILYHVSSTLPFSPRAAALKSYSMGSSSGVLPEDVLFLKLEEEEIGGDVILLVDSAPQWIGNSTDDENSTIEEDLDPCPVSPPGLVGRLKVDTNPASLEEQERAHTALRLGGHFLPRNCTALQKVAIIIPYRDRRNHLTVLIHHLHPILQRQQIEYNIYVVQQAGADPFNRGMLMNVGFMEAMKQYPFDCIILHDVDLVPEDDRNLYMCSQTPRHMSASISSHNYTLMYADYFGGVSAMTAGQFKAINGFSNSFWGWGGEDDDLFNRLKHKKMKISRDTDGVGRYTMLGHKKAKPNPFRHRVLRRGKRRFTTDGLRNLKYQILKTERRRLFTWMLVGIKYH